MFTGDINSYAEIAVYINKELAKGRTQKEIEIEDFNVNARVMAKRLTAHGYSKISGRWLNNWFTGSNTHSNTVGVTASSSREAVQGNEVLSKSNYDALTFISDNISSIKGLLSLYTDNMLLIGDTSVNTVSNTNSNTSSNTTSKIEIHLPLEDKPYKTSIGINKVIYDKFGEFCSRNGMFQKKDLMSMALKEYMDKYDTDDNVDNGSNA